MTLHAVFLLEMHSWIWEAEILLEQAHTKADATKVITEVEKSKEQVWQIIESGSRSECLLALE